MQKQNYNGRCHCGNIRFTFVSDEITEGRRCNCSLCVRRGIVLSPKYIPETEFRLVSSLDKMSSYRWNDKVIDNFFCKACGIATHFGSPKYGYRINLGCVERIDASTIQIKPIDGRSMPIAENPGSHPGE